MLLAIAQGFVRSVNGFRIIYKHGTRTMEFRGARPDRAGQEYYGIFERNDGYQIALEPNNELIVQLAC
jgi:hypothetical protein